MFQSVFSFLHVVIQSHKFFYWGGGGQCHPQLILGGNSPPAPPVEPPLCSISLLLLFTFTSSFSLFWSHTLFLQNLIFLHILHAFSSPKSFFSFSPFPCFSPSIFVSLPTHLSLSLASHLSVLYLHSYPWCLFFVHKTFIFHGIPQVYFIVHVSQSILFPHVLHFPHILFKCHHSKLIFIVWWSSLTLIKSVSFLWPLDFHFLLNR